MKKSEAIRQLTAFCNFNTFKIIDDFSGDYTMTLEEGGRVLAFIEGLGMQPPVVKYSDSPICDECGRHYNYWEDET